MGDPRVKENCQSCYGYFSIEESNVGTGGVRLNRQSLASAEGSRTKIRYALTWGFGPKFEKETLKEK